MIFAWAFVNELIDQGALYVDSHGHCVLLDLAVFFFLDGGSYQALTPPLPQGPLHSGGHLLLLEPRYHGRYRSRVPL